MSNHRVNQLRTVEKTSGVEDLEECDECGRYFHSSCRTARLLEGRGCKCGVPTEQLISPEDLPETDESIAMQYQLKDLAEGSIRIRIFMSDELHEKLEVEGDEQSAVKIWGKNITQFLTKREERIDLSYRRKLVLAFGKPAGDKYLTFFAMMIREYGPNCHPAKAGEIGLEYLDSVQFFDKQERSQIYHSILNSYFKCAKDRGFSVVKFWACPPLPTTEYLFLGHPKQQLNSTEPRLIQFYQDMIASGAHIYSASNGLLIKPQREVVEVIMNAFENNAMMFRIVFDGIKKYKEQLRKKSGDSSAEKFRECLQTAARNEHNVLFNLTLRDNPAAIEIPKTANYLQMAESSYNFREIQFLEGMDFGTLGSNIASTSKLTKIILRSITPQNK
ncbi:hypothetical protein CAEBREN_19493 [Caenorhabditis brenneri]|uniref:histone acetyltransferase n=1 Tax=Caenorhabditis brenneri TaxID=135651 RepID=G0N4F7_CAEBE|nr:hypothetical protein CAEBREN_19493 [Caenorhabditis brenneri]